MNNAKKIVAGLIIAATLNIGAGGALAAPLQINCNGIKPAQVVALDCSDLKPTVSAKPELNVQEPCITYSPEVSRGITIRPIFQNISDDIQRIIKWAAQKVGLSPSLVSAVAQVESGGNPAAMSPVGAIGVMQLMPDTAKAMGVNPYNPEQNILGGAQYLRYQIDRFGGDVPKAVAAYNAGPAAVEKYGGVPPYSETRNFVLRVMTLVGGRTQN